MKKVKFYSSLALFSLSASLLVACSSKQEQVTTSSSEQTVQTSTSSSETTSYQQSQSTPNSSLTTSSSIEQPVSDLAEQATNTDIVTEDQVQDLQKVLEDLTEVSQEEQEATSEHITSLNSASPGAAEGFWTSTAGYTLNLNADGNLGDNTTIISDSYTDANGMVYMNAYSTITGYGFYIHYYPAGTPLIFTVYDYDSEGNVVEVEQKDYSDISRDRIFAGNGGYGIMKDGLDDYLNNIFYR